MPLHEPSATKRPAHRPPHAPTQTDRDTVAAMVAAGIAQVDIARVRGISEPTLRKHYRQELEAGTAALNTVVILEHIKRIKAGDFQAIKWWEQARMGWSERVVVDDRKPKDSLRIIVELVGGAATPQIEQSAPRTGLSDAVRRNVQLVG
jgi:hypothetical protein